MKPLSILTALSSRSIAAWIQQAQRRVIYAAPGIHSEAATALVELRARSTRVSMTVSIDFDEKTLRMGYGDLKAVEILSKAGIFPTHSPGFRSGILIVDDRGWIFTPTALYLEDEPQSEETPNAVELLTTQVKAVAIRLSRAAQQEAIEEAKSTTEVEAIAELAIELGVDAVETSHIASVKKAIETAPPVKFDVARQVRVFEPYFQYVELSLTGAALQRHRICIPKELQNLGVSEEIKGKFKTTFDLIEKDSSITSKELEDELKEIRDDFTRSLGKHHGRVVLKSAKRHLRKRIKELRIELQTFQEKLKENLQSKIDASKKQIVDYYFPLVEANPPDVLRGHLLGSSINEEGIRAWIRSVLDKAYPKVERLVGKMALEERYKDVTLETLNHPDLLQSIKDAFPLINWEKAYDEFKAAGEKANVEKD